MAGSARPVRWSARRCRSSRSSGLRGAHRPAGAGAHLDPGHRPARGPRRRGRDLRAQRLRRRRRRRAPPRLAGAGRAARRAAARPAGRQGAGCASSSSGAVVGAHVGPGTLAVAVVPRVVPRRGALTDGVARVVEIAVVAVVCFLIGSVNPASLVARALGHDLRTAGSGNPGRDQRRAGARPQVGSARPRPRRREGVPADPARAADHGDRAGARRRARGGARSRVQPLPARARRQGRACALGAVLALEPLVGLAAVVVFALAKTVVPFVGEASVVTMLVVAVVGVFGGGAGAVRRRRSSGGGWCCCR